MNHISTVPVSAFGADDIGDAPWWPIFRLLRTVRADLGLRSHHLNTLAALLSFLKPGSGGLIVFASNRAILDRLNGASERTLQRHVADLENAGILRRQDSSNRKRFRLRAASSKVLAFGLDLSPLMARAEELAGMAELARHRLEERALIRQRILIALAQLQNEGNPPDNEQEIRLSLRRKVDLVVLHRILMTLTAAISSPPDVPVPEAPAPVTAKLSANCSQNVGHYQKSENISLLRDRGAEPELHRNGDSALFHNLTSLACPSALEWMLDGDEPPPWDRLLRKAPVLASWIGIQYAQYTEAVQAIGPDRAAATLLCIVQAGKQILHPPAYFRSLTTGGRAKAYCVERWLKRLVAAHPCLPR